MAAGDAHLSGRERAAVDEALRRAESQTRWEFSAYVGPLGQESRERAVALHAGLRVPERSVLVAVDPSGRSLEIVTGADVRRRLSDAAARLAVASMESHLRDHQDVPGALCAGLHSLAEAGRTR